MMFRFGWKRAFLLIALSSILCNVSGAQTNTRRGAGLGAAAGAVIGGIIGHQNDETSEGVLIGGAVGALTGGLMGNQRDWQQRQLWQSQQNAYYYQRPPQLQLDPRQTLMSDVVMMSRHGLNDVTIVNHIRQKRMSRALTATDVIQLHQQGVSELVINAMQQSVNAVAMAPYYRMPTVGVPVRVASPCSHHYPHHRTW